MKAALEAVENLYGVVRPRKADVERVARQLGLNAVGTIPQLWAVIKDEEDRLRRALGVGGSPSGAAATKGLGGGGVSLSSPAVAAALVLLGKRLGSVRKEALQGVASSLGLPATDQWIKQDLWDAIKDEVRRIQATGAGGGAGAVSAAALAPPEEKRPSAAVVGAGAVDCCGTTLGGTDCRNKSAVPKCEAACTRHLVAVAMARKLGGGGEVWTGPKVNMDSSWLYDGESLSQLTLYGPSSIGHGSLTINCRLPRSAVVAALTAVVKSAAKDSRLPHTFMRGITEEPLQEDTLLAVVRRLDEAAHPAELSTSRSRIRPVAAPARLVGRITITTTVANAKALVPAVYHPLLRAVAGNCTLGLYPTTPLSGYENFGWAVYMSVPRPAAAQAPRFYSDLAEAVHGLFPEAFAWLHDSTLADTAPLPPFPYCAVAPRRAATTR